VTLYGDTTRSTFGIVLGVVRAVAEQMNFLLSNTKPVVGVDTGPVASPAFRAIDFFIPGIIGLTVMTNTLYAMTSLCAEYRTRRYFKLLATTTLTKAEWLGGKILWFSLSLLVSVVATLATGALVWGAHWTLDAFLVGFVVLGAILFASMGMVLGAYTKDPESASALANAIGFPMMFLSGSFWPLESMPPYLQTVAQALPLTYVNEGLRDAMVFGNQGGALTNLAVVAVVMAVFFALAAKLMSWKER